MIRMVLGAGLAAFLMTFIGFIFFGMIDPTGSLGDAEAASVQQALAANLPRTGTYSVPAPGGSPAQTVMYGQGPIATIHYNVEGFAAEDATMILVGLGFNFLIALLIGIALMGIDRRVPDFKSRARVAVIVAVAAVAFNHLGEPIYWHHDWGHFIYLFIADGLALVAAGLVVARFLPDSGPEQAAAPTDV